MLDSPTVARNPADRKRSAPEAGRAPLTDPTIMRAPSGHPKVLAPESREELKRARRRRRASGALSPRPYNLTISHAYRFVWFRNAKVGTRSIIAFLEEQHPDELMVLSNVPYPTAAFTDYFKFGFVRHPLDRFISAWQDKVVDRNHFQFGPEKRERMKTIERFATWVSKQDLRDLSETDRHVALQSRLVDLTQVDFVGRIETFGPDFSEVCSRVGLSWKEPQRRNRSAPSGITRENASEELRAIVEEVYRLDYQVFGY